MLYVYHTYIIRTLYVYHVCYTNSVSQLSNQNS